MTITGETRNKENVEESNELRLEKSRKLWRSREKEMMNSKDQPGVENQEFQTFYIYKLYQ